MSDKIAEKAQKISANLGPRLSKKKYEEWYCKFMTWREQNFCLEKDINEDQLLVYFAEHSEEKKVAPSTLFPLYSMLKSKIYNYHQLDISKYRKLYSYIKDKNIGYRPRKAKALSEDNINIFLSTAPDDIYLAIEEKQAKLLDLSVLY